MCTSVFPKFSFSQSLNKRSKPYNLVFICLQGTEVRNVEPRPEPHVAKSNEAVNEAVVVEGVTEAALCYEFIYVNVCDKDSQKKNQVISQ